MLSRFAAGVLMFCASSVQAADVGPWKVVHSLSNGAPTGCLMSTVYTDKTVVGLLVNKQYEWAIGFANNSWKMTTGAVATVSAYVDGRLLTTGQAKILASNLAALPLSTATQFRMLQEGRSLSVRGPGASLNYNLVGTSKAMSAVLECVASLNRANPVGSPAAAANPKRDFQMVPPSEATVMVTNLLSGSGVAGFQLEPAKPENSAVYYRLPDGTRGSFLASRGHDTPTADDYAGRVIASWTQSCKGEFMSGKQSIPTNDGSVVRKLAGTCKTGDKVAVIETTIVRGPSGFLMDLNHSYDGASAVAPPAPSTAASSVVNAAIRFAGERK